MKLLVIFVKVRSRNSLIPDVTSQLEGRCQVFCWQRRVKEAGLVFEDSYKEYLV